MSDLEFDRAASRPLRTIRSDLRFPEGPRWRSDRLWLSDIHSHRVLAIGHDGTTVDSVELTDRPSGLGFLADGTMLVSSILDRHILAVRAGRVSIHADVSSLCGGFINDMVVDARGNAYVGGRNGGPSGSPTDILILVRPDGSSLIVADNLIAPNGAVVTLDGKHLIVAETVVGQLTRFTIQDDGLLVDRVVWARRDGRLIDGICLDARGNIWCGGSSSAYLMAPGGEVIDEILTPGRLTLAVALGGPDGRTLYLATTGPALHDNINKVGSNRALDAGTSSDGRIEAVEVEVPGVQAP